MSTHHFEEKIEEGERNLNMWHWQTVQGFVDVRSCCATFVFSLKYSVRPLPAPRLMKHTMAIEQPWIHSAILRSSQATASCSEERKGNPEEGTREEEQSLTRASINRSCPSHVGLAACSTNPVLCTPICQLPHFCVSVWVCFMRARVGKKQNHLECAVCLCLRVRERLF